MKKLAVIACGWHYPSQFYEKMLNQKIPNGWVVDSFVISHRHPENENTIKEKNLTRSYTGDELLNYLDSVLYEFPLTEKDITNFGWKYIEKPNTMGDMEVFNQWVENYDYNDYDMFFITHDDNIILSDSLFEDVLGEDRINLYKPLVETRVGRDQFDIELVENNLDWHYLGNGYSKYIPKAMTPRGSFGFYTKDLIDKMGGKFSMDDISLTRVGETDTPEDHHSLADWNSSDGNFRDFLYESENLELVDKTRFISDTKRVSKYCIEGERGFIHKNNTSETHYKPAVVDLFKDIGDLR
tara:strand:+ start:126 stop:1016 length:891 start_codon:yes stop_codon:yes gene_type:complete